MILLSPLAFISLRATGVFVVVLLSSTNPYVIYFLSCCTTATLLVFELAGSKGVVEELLESRAKSAGSKVVD